jgi:hypothetical protein
VVAVDGENSSTACREEGAKGGEGSPRTTDVGFAFELSSFLLPRDETSHRSYASIRNISRPLLI